MMRQSLLKILGSGNYSMQRHDRSKKNRTRVGVGTLPKYRAVPLKGKGGNQLHDGIPGRVRERHRENLDANRGGKLGGPRFTRTGQTIGET